MKKKQPPSQSEIPAELAAALAEFRLRVKQQEEQGNFDTYDHTELARLKRAAAEYQESEVNNGT